MYLETQPTDMPVLQEISSIKQSSHFASLHIKLIYIVLKF